MEIFFVFLALVAGLIAGYALGVRTKYEQLVKLQARANKPQAARTDDPTFVPGFGASRAVPASRRPAMVSGDVTFSGSHVGDVYVTLWMPEELPTADVNVEIIWGGRRATITLPSLDANGVALRFTKKTAKTHDVAVRVVTNVPTHRFAGPRPLLETNPVRTDLTWS